MSDVTVVSGDFADAAAARLRGLVEAALRARGACSVALSGGSTPRPVYERLGVRDDRLAFYFGDERCVPPGDPESNYAMARAALGEKARLLRIEGERKDRDGAARDYEALLPRELDVVVLGIGDDGHTASLFPGFPALDETKRRVVVVGGAPKPPPWRITITPPVIAAARSILVLVTGAGKAPAVARALEGALDPRQVPAQLARRGTWLLDAAAAAQLGRKQKA